LFHKPCNNVILTQMAPHNKLLAQMFPDHLNEIATADTLL
jgi:hypothetical protein